MCLIHDFDTVCTCALLCNYIQEANAHAHCLFSEILHITKFMLFKITINSEKELALLANLPIFLFNVGLLTLINMDSLVFLAKQYLSLPII